jgi:hypothetical protein
LFSRTERGTQVIGFRETVTRTKIEHFERRSRLVSDGKAVRFHEADWFRALVGNALQFGRVANKSDSITLEFDKGPGDGGARIQGRYANRGARRIGQLAAVAIHPLTISEKQPVRALAQIVDRPD